MSDPPVRSFTCKLLGNGGAIGVPFDPRAAFGQARPPVIVEVNGHRYRSTIAIMNGETFVPFRRSNRAAAGVAGGDTIAVTLTLDTQPRSVALPGDVAARIDAAGLRGAWERLSYSRQREHVEVIDGAKRPETRVRRMEALLGALAAAS